MWIKICGIRDVAMAQAVAEFRPAAIGLNFYAASPRAVRPDVAAEIVRALPPDVEPIGLFVNHAVADVLAICRECRLTTVQIHGDEPPELLAELRELRVIRAFRLGEEGLAPLGEYLDRCRALGALPHACLVDSKVDGAYGGTGRTPSWDVLRRDFQTANWPPLVLAGGLHPQNVERAIRAVNPWGVDVASGVESAPGVKSLALVESFIANAARPNRPANDG